MSVQIEVISAFSTDGRITPLRFRMEDNERGLQTVPILQVLYEAPIHYAGIDAIQYFCKAVREGRERLFELRYTLQTHRWSLFQVVY